MFRAAIITVSDRAARGEYEDRSGPLLRELVEKHLPARAVEMRVVADEREEIAGAMRDIADNVGVNLLLTTGGTGFAPRDVTPEATRSVIDREAPGLAEAMRQASLRITPHAMLSRAVTGIRGRTLIINLPGSPKAVQENLETLLPVLSHALELLADTAGANQRHEPPA